MKVAIIGGAGKMGRWFADFLLKDGKEVVISGRNRARLLEARQQLGVAVASDNIAAVKSADVVLLSVPIDSFEGVVKQISPHIKPEQIVIDVTSIKVIPVATLHKYIKTGMMLGAHPLFGPGARSVANQNFILTPTNEAEEALARKVRDYLEARKAKVSLMTPHEHDDMMAIILGLSHFIAIVSADTLLSSNRMKKIEAFGGITYKVLLTLVESVLTEDPELYASLQMSLPDVTEIEELFQKRAREWTDLIAKKDRHEFTRRMNDLKERFEQVAPDFGRAYENMYRITDSLQ